MIPVAERCLRDRSGPEVGLQSPSGPWHLLGILVFPVLIPDVARDFRGSREGCQDPQWLPTLGAGPWHSGFSPLNVRFVCFVGELIARLRVRGFVRVGDGLVGKQCCSQSYATPRPGRILR